MSQQWSVSWTNEQFSEFLFSTGDFKHWLIVRKTDLIGDDGEKWYSNEDVEIQASSISCVPYKAKMYRRVGQVEDPWVSFQDHHQIPSTSMVYGGNSAQGHDFLLEKSHGDY